MTYQAHVESFFDELVSEVGRTMQEEVAVRSPVVVAADLQARAAESGVSNEYEVCRRFVLFCSFFWTSFGRFWSLFWMVFSIFFISIVSGNSFFKP